MADTPPNIVIGLANEQVPVCAIARAMRVPAEDVREVLREALELGTIAEVPREDWLAGKFGQKPVGFKSKQVSDEDLVYNCIRLFKVTRLQASLLAVLLVRTEVSKEAMHQVIEQRRKANTSETDPKMVDVVICHLRKRLRPFKLKITTLWACGYYMEPEHRARANQLLADFATSIENGN